MYKIKRVKHKLSLQLALV